jgi:hypothetical protein
MHKNCDYNCISPSIGDRVDFIDVLADDCLTQKHVQRFIPHHSNSAQLDVKLKDMIDGPTSANRLRPVMMGTYE